MHVMQERRVGQMPFPTIASHHLPTQLEKTGEESFRHPDDRQVERRSNHNHNDSRACQSVADASHPSAGELFAQGQNDAHVCPLSIAMEHNNNNPILSTAPPRNPVYPQVLRQCIVF
mmetsp:Transcript_24870/g.69161  ORF Transcript_24870/g.69161 Transcript_24870/m.69161 type:complete len:117 (-) Transcript_24870:1668-2018(-)